MVHKAVELAAKPAEDDNDSQKMGKIKSSSAGGLPTLQDYMDYIRLLHTTAWKDAPSVPITYKDLSYRIKVPKDETANPSVAKAFIDMFKPKQREDFAVFQNLTGHIPNGKMTLVLGPPSCGKSQLLKTWGGHMRYNKNVTGDLFYDSLSADEQLEAGIYTQKLCALVAQGDVHMANLTVRETLQFAFKNSTAPLTKENFPGHDLDPQLLDYHHRKVELLLSVLGMHECADTIAGNPMIRGISGGQKKRLTIGEMMVSNARVLLLDEPTTGLDAAVARDIMVVLKNWCEVSGATVISALLQPTPECYALYDDLILLKDGEILYHGPRNEVEQYIEQYWGLVKPPAQDAADFIVDVLTSPLEQYEKQEKAIKRKKYTRQFPLLPLGPSPSPPVDSALTEHGAFAITTDAGSEVTFHADDSVSQAIANNPIASPSSADAVPHSALLPSASPASGTPGFIAEHAVDPFPLRARQKKKWLISTAQLVAVYRESPYHQRQVALVEGVEREREIKRKDLQSIQKQRSQYTLQQYGNLFTCGVMGHIKHSFDRQFTLLARDKQTAPQRAMSAVVQAVIFGSLFLQLDVTDYYSKLGILLFSLMFFAMGNFTELPAVFEGRNAVYKQVDAGMFPVISYILAFVLSSIPVMVAETFLYSIPLYFMISLASDAGRFFFFCLIMFVIDIFFSSIFRAICYRVVSIDQAQQVAMPVLNLCMLFSGFLILKPSIRDWQIEFYWLSPFSWAVRSLALNEFNDPSYDFHLADSSERAGNSYMTTFGISTNSQYKWAGFGYLMGLNILLVFVASYWLKNVRFDLLQGTKRMKQHEYVAQEKERSRSESHLFVAVQEGSKIPPRIEDIVHESSMNVIQSVLPFQPTSLSFKDVIYTIDVQNTDPNSKGPKSFKRSLLNGVSGYVKPGQLVALMGSSGAGKTTLMDVIAGRKTSGVIEGEIRINGALKSERADVFPRITGYCEQQDIHMPLATVRESLMFSANLRLPRFVTDDQKRKFVDELLDILELQHLADRIVGNEKYSGLSPGQLKLLTIGVELAANPSILFLDEPTSGLDSRAAVVVMRVVKRIAQTGRSVLCTIHQPSADVFFHFDAMLLLRTGGYPVFFGDIGEEGCELVRYFESKANESGEYPRCPAGTNPASWMLDVIGAGLSGSLKRANAGKKAKESGKTVGAQEEKAFDYADVFKESDLYAMQMEQLELVANPPEPVEVKVNPEDYVIDLKDQIRHVMSRSFICYWRDHQVNLGRTMTLIFICLIFGLVYLKLDHNSYSGLTSQISAVFSVAGFLAMLSAQITLPGLISERAVFYRERASNCYPAWVYATTLSLMEVIPVFASTLLGVIIFYFIVGFEHSGTLFFQFYCAMSVIVLIESSFGQLAAAVFPNFVVAIQIAGVINTLFFLFGGLFIRPSDIPRGWKWFYYMNPIPKAIIAIVMPQLECHLPNPYDVSSGCPTITDPNTGEVTIHAYVQAQWDSSYDGAFGRMMGWLALTWFVFVLGLQLSLKYINHMKR